MQSEYQRAQQAAAEEVARAISAFVNRGGNVGMLADAMLNDHPTLQQKQMGLVLEFVRGMAGKGYVDARNEASRDLARRVVAAIGDDAYLPFI